MSLIASLRVLIVSFADSFSILFFYSITSLAFSCSKQSLSAFNFSIFFFLSFFAAFSLYISSPSTNF